jgi:hypothetical protein
MGEDSSERTYFIRLSRWVNHSSFKTGIAFLLLLPLGVSVNGEDFVTPGPNVNLIGATPNPENPLNIADFGLKQQQEPSCVIRPSNNAYIMCAYNDLRASDTEVQGDSWIGYSESGDKGLTWRSYLAPGYKLHPTNSVQNVGFAADPSLVAIPGSYALPGSDSVDSPGLTILNYIGANRDSNVGVLVAQRFVDNEQEDERHNSPEDGHFIIADGSSGRFIDKPAFLFVASDSGSQSYVQKSINIEGPGAPIDVSVTSGTLVVAYAVFTGSSSVKVYIQTSIDLGENWSHPTKVSESLNEVTGVSLSAIGQKVVATWRQKADTNNPDAVISTVSKNNNLTSWTKPKEVFAFCPFDQPATGVSFRSFAFPWVANDGNRFWTFVADRRFDAPGGESTSCDPIPELPGTYDGIPRIVGMSSTDGINWFGDDAENPGAPFIVDPNTDDPMTDNGKPLGFQVMPSAVGTKGRIDLAWYDTRREALSLPLQGDGSTEAQIPLIYDYSSSYTDSSGQLVAARVLRKADVWMTRLAASSGCGSSGVCAPDIQSPVRVSQYPVAFAPSISAAPYATPLEVEAHLPNHRLYASGTLAFKGDYIAIETPRLRKTVSGAWVNNSKPVDSGSDLAPSAFEDVFVAWGDNRDVRVDYASPYFPAADDDGQVPYTPPGGPAQATSTGFKLGEIEEGASEPLVQVDSELKAVTESDDSEDPTTPADNTLTCSVGQDFSRSRDSNIYGSVVADAPSLRAPTNNKPLGTIQRMFPLVLNNPDTTSAKNFCLVIRNQPEGAPQVGRASFFQLPAVPPFTTSDPGPLTRLPVTVGPGSTESRAVFVFASNTDVVRIDAYLDNSMSELCEDDLASNEFTGALQNSIFVSDGSLLDSGYCATTPTPDACLPTAIEETHNISLASLNLQAPVIKASVTQESLNLQALNLQAPALGALNLQALNLQAPTIAALNLQALNLQALNLQALNLQALNLQALNLQALNLQALNLQALNLQAPSLGDGSNPTSPTYKLEQAVLSDNVYYQDVTYIVNTDANVTTTYSADIKLDVNKLKTNPLVDEDPVVQLIAWTPNSVNSASETGSAACGGPEPGFQAQVLAFTTLDALNLQALDLPETINPEIQNPYKGTISFTGIPNQKIALTVRTWATGGTKDKMVLEFDKWVACMNEGEAAEDPEYCSNQGIGNVIKFGASAQGCATSDKVLIDEVTGEPVIDPATGLPIPVYDDSDCLNDEDEKIRPDFEPPTVVPIDPSLFLPPVPYTTTSSDPIEITIIWPITATDEIDSLDFACTIGGEMVDLYDSSINGDQLTVRFTDEFPIGTTQVSCSVTDSSGNATTADFPVEVIDGVPPVWTTPDDIVEVNADPDTGTVDANTLTNLTSYVVATDNVGIVGSVSCSADPSTITTLTPSTVTCTASDGEGNESEGTYSIIAKDITAPMLTPLSGLVQVDLGEATGTVDASLLDLASYVVATDNVDTVVGVSCSAVPNLITTLSASTVTCKASDLAENESTVTYQIIAKDITAPVLIPPSDLVEVDADPDTGTVTASSAVLASYVDATDNVGIVGGVSCIADPNPITTLSASTVTCSASDGVNLSMVMYSIIAKDITPPVLIPPSDLVEVDADPATGTVDASLLDLASYVVATDNVDTVVGVSCSAVPNLITTLSESTVTCTAIDGAGNDSTVMYQIIANDDTAPAINASNRTVYRDYDPANKMYPFWGIIDAAELSSGVTVTDGGVDITSSANLSCSRDEPPEQIEPPADPAAPLPPLLTDADFEFIDGDFILDEDEPYSITCTASDLSGNPGTASFLLTVSYLYDINLELPKGRARAGSTIPIDFDYREWEWDGGAIIDSSLIPVRVSWAKMTDDSCEIQDTNVPEESSGLGEDSGNSDFRYSFSSDQWQFSWQTPPLIGYYRLAISPPGKFVDNATACVNLR